jgi:hypothetical protein
MPPAFSVVPEQRTELRTAIMQSVPPLVQQSPGLTGCVAGDLFHPCLIGMPRDSCQANTATLQVDQEQDVIRDQPASGEDLDREEINPGQDGHMRLDEFLPRRGLAPFGRRLNPMSLQDVSYGLIPAKVDLSGSDKRNRAGR